VRPPFRYASGIRAIDDVIARLDGALTGPAGSKARLLTEMRDGLCDATDALVAGGRAPAAAAERAVRDFGPLERLASECQVELAAAQARRTALAVALYQTGLSGLWSVITATQSSVPWKSGGPVVGAISNLSGVFLLVVTVAAIALARGFGQRHLHRAPWLVVAMFGGLVSGLFGWVFTPETLYAPPVLIGWCLTALVIAVLCRSMARSRALTSSPDIGSQAIH